MVNRLYQIWLVCSHAWTCVSIVAGLVCRCSRRSLIFCKRVATPEGFGYPDFYGCYSVYLLRFSYLLKPYQLWQ